MDFSRRTRIKFARVIDLVVLFILLECFEFCKECEEI